MAEHISKTINFYFEGRNGFGRKVVHNGADGGKKGKQKQHT